MSQNTVTSSISLEDKKYTIITGKYHTAQSIAQAILMSHERNNTSLNGIINYY
jgi:hypothetical protein